MRIAIDVSQIVYGTGVSHYRVNLVNNLLKVDKNNEYLLYAGAFHRLQDLRFKIYELSKDIGNVSFKIFPIPPRLSDFVWNKLHILPIEKLIGDVDLVHSSDWVEPPSKFSKVTTVHDLIPLKFPKLTSKIIVDTHRRKLEWVAKESKRIIVPSLSTKKDLEEIGFDTDIIRVVNEAPNLSRATDSEIGKVKRKYRVFGNYLIAIGTAPRKNIEKIVKAYHLVKFGKDLKLVIVGENTNQNSFERGVIFVGNPDDKNLSALLSGASALVFPSLYEGFGLPILDAFNCRIPVVTSNISSMPEVAGEAAILVDPYDVDSISTGIDKALSSPKSLITKGLKRVKSFSWQKTAEETLKVYNEIAT